MGQSRSPYSVVFGDRLDGLHPRLHRYFSAIPAGSSGRGAGIFRVVGTPHRWLWPVLWALGKQGVLFPVWATDVPFTVVNRPLIDRSGNAAVAAVRTFHLPGGERGMVDAITAENGELVDHLGDRRRYAAWLEGEIVNGALYLRSTRMAVRIGRKHIHLPKLLAPRVSLVERFDDEAGMQSVSVVLDAPVIGRIYEYAGTFIYDIRMDENAEEKA